MKSASLALLASLTLLAGCSSWGGFQFDNDEDCHNVVDARARLDCFDQAKREQSERQQEQQGES